jgi:hypothetical protein
VHVAIVGARADPTLAFRSIAVSDEVLAPDYLDRLCASIDMTADGCAHVFKYS